MNRSELEAGGEIFAEGALTWAQNSEKAWAQPIPIKSVAKSNSVGGMIGM